MTASYTLVGLPSGRRGKVARGTGLRTALRGLGVGVESICAENATCGKCKILVEEGRFEEYGVVSSRANLSTPEAEETDYFDRRRDMMARRGWTLGQVRLACQAKLLGDVVVTVPEESRADKQIVRKSATTRHIDIKPSIRKYLVELSPPTLTNPRADWDRLASGIVTCMGLVRSGEVGLPQPGDLAIDRECLRKLPDVLRQSNWRVTVSIWKDREVLRVEPGLTDRLIGAAVDIGTTTVALYLCDLSTGETLCVESEMNPQIAFGEDVMSRIQFSTSSPDGLQRLHKSIIKTLNQLLLRAATHAGVSTDDVLELVMVGNTTMQHLFLNLAPTHLGAAPFVPVTSRSVDIKARGLRLAMNESANVHVLPGIASFIGADTTGVLLAEEPHEQDEIWLIIDIGTNAELVLGNRRQLLCASTPTGPALEGAHIEHGMRAAPGAIEHIRIHRDSLIPEWKLIGEDDWGAGLPKGLCGSAVVDAVAELVRVGAVDSSGRFAKDTAADGRIRRVAGGPEYVIAFARETRTHADICLTQKDVRQIQLAKGALFVAAQSLLDRSGIEAPDKVLLAGAFGSYMDKANAVAIGMLPHVDVERVFVVGNAAGDGARIALLNSDKRRGAAQLAERITRYELPADPDFQERFIHALAFPWR
ncbi:MAG: ASKHA domain-containing protein [Chloroflexota bacterium]